MRGCEGKSPLPIDSYPYPSLLPPPSHLSSPFFSPVLSFPLINSPSSLLSCSFLISPILSFSFLSLPYISFLLPSPLFFLAFPFLFSPSFFSSRLLEFPLFSSFISLPFPSFPFFSSLFLSFPLPSFPYLSPPLHYFPLFPFLSLPLSFFGTLYER